MSFETSNRRRCLLIRKDVEQGLGEEEKGELERLEALTDKRLAQQAAKHPPEPDEIEKTVERLKREGKWPKE